jgi:hypothetical protein
MSANKERPGSGAEPRPAEVGVHRSLPAAGARRLEILRDALKALPSEIVELVKRSGDQGPLRTWHQLANGQLATPGLRWLHDTVPGSAVLGNPIGWRLAAVVAPVLLGALVVSLTDEVVRSDLPDVWEVSFGVLCVAFGVIAAVPVYAVALKATGKRISSRAARWTWWDRIYVLLLSVVLTTVAFAAFAAVAAKRTWLTVGGDDPPDPVLALDCVETLVWYFLSIDPFVNIPDTFSWNPGLRFEGVIGGLLVVAYKVFLLVPLAQLIARLAKRVFA